MNTEFADRYLDGFARPVHSKRVDLEQVQDRLSQRFTLDQVRDAYEKAKAKGWIVDAKRTTPGNQWKPDASSIKIARMKAEEMDRQRQIQDAELLAVIAQ